MLERAHKPLELHLSEITVDLKYQVRKEGINEEHLNRLAEVDEDIEDITRESPVIVFATGLEYILVEGFHRFGARRKNNRLKIWTICYSGTERDARLYKLTRANSEHGLELSKQSRIARIEELLIDKDWGKWSIAAICEKTRESRNFVNYIRKRMMTEGRLPELEAVLEAPDDLTEKQAEKWEEVKESGRVPVLVERNGQVVVEAKRGAKKQAVDRDSNECDTSGTFQQKAADLKGGWVDEYGNPIPKFLNDALVSGESFAGVMRSDVKYLRSIPIGDWVRDNPWLAQQVLSVEAIDPKTGKKSQHNWGVRAIMDWMITSLHNCRPAAVCPVCEDDSGHCDMCHNKRWLPPFVYESIDKDGV